MKKTLIIIGLIALLLPMSVGAVGNKFMHGKLADNLKGKILLQVEDNGEAWYVNPEQNYRHYMGRPDDAFGLMRSFGLGVSNEDLNKIQIGILEMSALDSDGDGLTDDFEQSQGINKDLIDSDGDGFNDYEEIINGYSPVYDQPQRLKYDSALTERLSGRIMLQVESAGEAWYLNPDDNKRYYLGRPADAFEAMRSLGLGIKTDSLNEITIYQRLDNFSVNVNVPVGAGGEVENNSSGVGFDPFFAFNFSKCRPASLYYDIPVFKITGYYEILGRKNNRCEMKFHYINYPTDGWNDKEMTCTYDNGMDFYSSYEKVLKRLYSDKDKGDCTGELAESYTKAIDNFIE